MLNWFRGIKSTEVTVEVKKPSPRKSLFSTHDVDDSSFDIIKSNISDMLSDLKRKQPMFDPKVNSRMANAAMDDSSDGFPEFKMYDAGNNSVSNAVVFWYASQGFIGAQMCGIIAQNWLVNKACAMPADDAIRKGYNIVAVDGEELDPEAVKIMKSVDRSMRLEWNMREFIRKGRIFGVRVAMFKVQSTDKDYYEKPFNIDGVTAGSYKGIVQVDPYWCAPMLDGPSASEPDTLHFYEPTWWIINGKKVHRSHLIIFRHAEPVDVLKPQYIYGGVPLTQQIMERVYAAERTSNEAPQLAMSKRTTVWLTDMEAVMANTQDAVSRLQQWAQFRDNYGVKLGDKEGDEFQQFDTSLADFDALIMTQYQLVAAIAGVPATKLIGTSPKGFGASGEYEEASYHEMLESIQTHDLTPLAERHHQLVIKSFVEPQLKMKMSTETTLNWLPLDTPTAQELAATNLAKAQVGQILLNAGAVSSEEERQRVATDKTSGYNEIGLEDNPPPEPPDNNPDGSPPDEEEEDHLNAQDEAAFTESKHPRANNGQFGSGVGGTKSPKPKSASHKEASASKGSSEKNGSPPPKAGEPFVVYRVAEREGLENRNAGNADGVALHVMNQQSSEGARTRGNAPDHIYAYRIIPDSDVDGKYEGATYSGTLKGDKVGRVENKYGIAYSFPEKGYKSELIGKVSLEDLKKKAGGDFDDLGTKAGGELIRNHFEGQTGQDAIFHESDHPRAKNGQFGSGGSHAISEDPHSQAKTTAPITTPASKEAMANKVPSHLTAKKQAPKAAGKTAKGKNPFPVGSNKVDAHGFERSPNLNPKERAIETGFYEAILNHLPELISEYKEKFGNEIDPDKVKELDPNFSKDKSLAAAVHEPSSYLSKLLWKNALEEKAAAGDTSPTLFTAGGSGSGKSEAMKVAKGLVGAKDDALTFDSVLGNFKSATQKINEALETTKGNVDIIYTNAPIETATFLNLRRERTVRMATLMEAHIKASANIKALQDHYKDNPRVKISVINNQGAGLENMVRGKLTDVPTYNIEGMRERILNHAKKVVAEGKIKNGPKKLKMLLQGEDSA